MNRVITNAYARIRSKIVKLKNKKDLNKKILNKTYTHWLKIILLKDI
jgi:hypothetical protein